MEPEAEEIIAATQAINMVDVSQYPQCAEMEQRCAESHRPYVPVADSDRTESEHFNKLQLPQIK